MSLVLGVVLVVLLMAASGVLVAAETSLLHIRRAQAEVLADSGTEADDSVDRSDLLDLLDDRVRGLGPLLFVLMALRLSAAGLLAIVVADRVGASWAAVALAGLLVVGFALVDVLPRTMALRTTDRRARCSQVGPLRIDTAFQQPLGQVRLCRNLGRGIQA